MAQEVLPILREQIAVEKQHRLRACVTKLCLHFGGSPPLITFTHAGRSFSRFFDRHSR
jgi:hypothetical protein